MSLFYRDFPHFFSKCTVISPISYRDFLTALVMTIKQLQDRHLACTKSTLHSQVRKGSLYEEPAHSDLLRSNSGKQGQYGNIQNSKKH